jgi:hypothetical protein
MRTITLALVATLVTSSTTSHLLAQEEKEAKEKTSATPSLHALAEATEIRLDKAITLALKAREGVAVGVELEGKVVDNKVVPQFEVMVCGKDGAVYEVLVNGVDGAIVSKDPCKDEEDTDEVKAIVGSGESHTSLQDIVAETRKVLRGTCVQAALGAKDKQAHVVLLNRGRRLATQWSLKDGQLLGVSWLDAKKPKKAGDDDEGKDEDDEKNEGGKRENGEGQKAGKSGNGKKAKSEGGKEEEGEKHEKSEGTKHREHEKDGKDTGEKPKDESKGKLQF